MNLAFRNGTNASHWTALVSASLALTLIACGEDDSPTSPNGTPAKRLEVSLSVRAGDWAIRESYTPPNPPLDPSGRTTFLGSVDFQGVDFRNVSGGDTLRFQFDFRDPLEVTRDLDLVQIQVWGTLVPGGGAVADVDFIEGELQGNWQGVSAFNANYLGDSGSGATRSYGVGVTARPMVGERLEGLVARFVVPEEFNVGTPIGDTPELPLSGILWAVIYLGDQRGNPPPIAAQ